MTYSRIYDYSLTGEVEDSISPGPEWLNGDSQAAINDSLIDFNRTEEEWIAAQDTYIGASQAAILFGEGYSGSSPTTLWESMVHPENSPKMESDLLLMGQLLEKPIAEMYARKVDVNLWFNDRRIWRHRDYPFIGCTPDFLDFDNNQNVQVKNVSNIGAGAEWADDQCPLKYQIQCQQEMLCTGMHQSVLVGWVCGKLEYRVIDRNEKFIQVLIERVSDFWNNHVLTRIPPPDDFTEAAYRVFSRLHPDDSGETVMLDGHITGDDLDEWEAASKMKKEGEEKIKAIQAKIAPLMGDATFGIVGNRCISWKTQMRKGYTVQPSKSRVMRTHNKIPKEAK